MERKFIVSVIEEDVPEQFKDDLEGHIRGAIGLLLNMDADVGFSVVEFEKSEKSEEKRYCVVCGKEMTEGYVIGDGESYYCSGECLNTVMTDEEYLELYDNDQAYWTEW